MAPAGNEPIVHEACHSHVTGFMHDRGKCMVAVCLLGSAGAPSFVLHRCMYIYIIACLLLVIQRTGFSIKFAFPWLPDQAGMEFLRGTDGKVDEPFRRPMHKDTCTHMLLCATNTQVCICACIPTSFRLVIQATELIIKFTFPWRPAGSSRDGASPSAPMESGQTVPSPHI